jgi:hypothetical protein
MSFDKEYPNRKDWRKRYYNAKSFDRSCRNHGSCAYCTSSRLHKHKKKSVDNLISINISIIHECFNNIPL